MLLAYERGTELIVAVGTHNSMEDFLDKGRQGMASTFLVRLKVGRILIDAKGVNNLYRPVVKGRGHRGVRRCDAAVARPRRERERTRAAVVPQRLAVDPGVGRLVTCRTDDDREPAAPTTR